MTNNTNKKVLEPKQNPNKTKPSKTKHIEPEQENFDFHHREDTLYRSNVEYVELG
jgi:hypothetical protein